MWDEQTFRDDNIPGGPLMSRCRHACGNVMTGLLVMWAPAWFRTDRESYPDFPSLTSGLAPLRPKHSWQLPRWVHICAKTNLFLEFFFYHTANTQVDTWILREKQIMISHICVTRTQSTCLLLKALALRSLAGRWQQRATSPAPTALI